jgi:hypothetical protein
MYPGEIESNRIINPLILAESVPCEWIEQTDRAAIPTMIANPAISQSCHLNLLQSCNPAILQCCNPNLLQSRNPAIPCVPTAAAFRSLSRCRIVSGGPGLRGIGMNVPPERSGGGRVAITGKDKAVRKRL